jgi:putative ABC transport system ATP-binding protein
MNRSNAMEGVIETAGVYKSYYMGKGTVDILQDINLSVKKGAFYSIMGPSGSGKSTLLYLLGGLDKPTKGSIKVNGKELSTMQDDAESKMRRRDIGFVFQFYNLIPNLDVEENILLPILLDGKKVKDYKAALNEILEVVGLTERRKFTPRELSGGQQQRVAIARALINSPDIILADEPIGNLDSKTGIEIMKLFQEINIKKGKTIIQVTHSKEAAEYGTDAIFLRDGRVC